MTENCYIAFNVRDADALARLTEVVDELSRQKISDKTDVDRDRDGFKLSDVDRWLPLFTTEDRAAFWWPTAAEEAEWNEFWFSTPLPKRHSAEMPAPGWDFGSMIDAILEGEYDLMGVQGTSPREAMLKFYPHAYPYGGHGALRALVRSFGHEITGFDDGTGYMSGDPLPPSWSPKGSGKEGFLSRLLRRS